jgi:two-component system sensor histidine kinase UhpB
MPVKYLSSAPSAGTNLGQLLSGLVDRGWPRARVTILRRSIHPHLFGLALVAIAFCLTMLHESFVGPSPVFGFYYLAIVATALMGGSRSAILALAAALVTILEFSLTNPTTFKLVHVGLFVAVSSCLIAIAYGMHRATRELQASERRVNDLFSSIDVLAQVLDPDGRIVYCNPHLLRLTGRRLDEMRGRKALELFAPRQDTLDESANSAGGFVAGNWPAETELTAISGARRIVRWHGAQLRSADGEIAGLALIGIDVTERIEADAAQRRLAAVVEGTEDAIFTVKFDGTITSWNSAAEKMFGYSAAEMVGGSALLLVPRDREREGMANRERLMRGEQIAQLETVRLTRDGRRLDVSLTLSPLRQGKELIGASAIMRDITLRKKAESSLRDLTRRLLTAEEAERSRIAKELHDSTAQNLVAVMMRLEGLRESAARRDANETREIEDCLAIFESSIHELRTLAYVLHPARLDEDGLVGAIQHYTQGYSERTGIAIALELAADFGRVSSTLEMVLFRFVQEALSNVYRHSHANSARIHLRRNGDTVKLEVSDNGIGLSLDAAGKPTRRGVGLAAMEERVRQVNGQFSIQSSRAGTTLRAVVPAEPLKS